MNLRSLNKKPAKDHRVIMKISYCVILFVYTAVPDLNLLYAQEGNQSCSVELEALVGTYTGECKNGFADGKGEAKGDDRYVGLFKKGLPDGRGVYYFGDSIYYSGNFQEGIKEGKGEMHYLRNGKPDSLIKGYWSGDEYRGSQYITYSFDGVAKFDLYEITPSRQSGNTVTFEISATSGVPNNVTRMNFINSARMNLNNNSANVLRLINLISTNGDIVQKISDFTTVNKFSLTYQLTQFPASLLAVLSNGQSFNLELYKAASWRVRLYVNK